MKALLLISFLLAGSSCYAQSTKIDLSKDPDQGKYSPNKSNASLLKETADGWKGKDIPDQHDLKYDSNVSGVSKPDNAPPPAAADIRNLNVPSNSNMNSTYQQGNLGNLKTNSTIHYDDAGKIRGANTTIKIGNK